MRAQRRGVDFSGGRRGAVVQPAQGKTRITIRLDTELLDWFREEVNRAGGGNYQTLINDVLREELARYAVAPNPPRGQPPAPARDIHRKLAPRGVVTRDDSR